LPIDAVLVFHDSEVRRVVADASAGTIAIHFSAAHILPSPEARVEDGEEDGFVGGVELCLSEARWTGPVPVCIGRIASGGVTLAGTHRATLPLPADIAGELHAELQFANGSQLLVTARRLEVRAEGGQVVGNHAC
jgi:hypothetical protein